MVIPEADRAKLDRWLHADPSLAFLLTAEADWVFNADYAQRLLLEHFKVATLEGFGINGQQAGTGAAGALLNYVKQTQKSDLGHILALRLFDNSAYLKLDEATIKNLELVKTNDGNREGSLLAVLDSTKTGMGARLLRSWLLRPILDLEEIGRRLDSVEELQVSAARVDRIGKVLREIHDVERLLSRVTLQTANGRDLLALKDSLRALPELQGQLASCSSGLVEPADRSAGIDCGTARTVD